MFCYGVVVVMVQRLGCCWGLHAIVFVQNVACHNRWGTWYRHVYNAFLFEDPLWLNRPLVEIRWRPAHNTQWRVTIFQAGVLPCQM